MIPIIPYCLSKKTFYLFTLSVSQKKEENKEKIIKHIVKLYYIKIKGKGE